MVEGEMEFPCLGVRVREFDGKYEKSQRGFVISTDAEL